MRLINGASTSRFSEDIFALLVARENEFLSQVFEQALLPPLGKIIGVDSIKIANEVGVHAERRR